MSEAPDEGIGGNARVRLISRIVSAARDVGAHKGGAAAYKDVLGEIEKALAVAEEELASIPHQSADLVMGEIMALRKLAAHFAPAPKFHEHRIAEYTARVREFIDEVVASVREAREDSTRE